jgi:hypothetical protein
MGEGTTQGPRLITDIKKPVLGVYQKRGENQLRFQVGGSRAMAATHGRAVAHEK